jgi:hypothetical protein
MKTKSSQKTRDQVLGVMSAQRAKRCLLDWANLRAASGDVDTVHRRLIQRYPEIFPAGAPDGPLMPSQQSEGIVLGFGMLLVKAWDARTLRVREWYLHDAESFYHRVTNRFADPPTHATPIEALVYYFRRNAERALHCPNPDCVAPYFFATKKGQKYCSDICALPAQRESKLRWWRENRSSTPPKKEK